ncbi:FUSC family protein [Lichenibacterium dinghuense]|uniref:FUSC family protein n=1 Tax=Lichenibacterium dinghuense TaxID=2895977 RepID=UPI001F23842F|nr:FUSC family protein [Lichenibacterium sp. 6Y81]
MTALGGDAPASPRRVWARVRAAVAPHLLGWSDWAYALHAALCALVALWLAMWFKLDAPYWAGSTVLITAQASRAQGLLKGLNRVVGTAVGTVMGVTLIALFPQGWWSYLLAHTAWLALCTFASCLLKDQQSYAAALSGYTALIVAFDSFGEPDKAFATALSRGSAVVLGVTLFTLTVLLLFPSNEAASLRASLRSWLDDGLGAAARLLRGEGGPDEVARFLPRLAKFDTEIENGATEAPWIRPRKPLLRGAVLGLVDCVMDAAARAEAPPAPGVAAEVEYLRPRVTERLPRDARGRPLWAPWAARPAPVRAARRARGGLGILRRDQEPEHAHPVSRAVDRDLGAAGLGALRAAFGMGSASAIWVTTRWPSGSDFVLITGIICCLFASRPSPVANGLRFALSTVLTAVCALGVGFYVLPLLSGFRFLAAVLFPFLLVGALGVRSSWAAYFTPLNFFLMTMANINNEMNYDPLTFFNSVEALVAGAIYGTLWFQLVPPPSKAMAARSLRGRLFRGAPRMAAGRPRAAEARLLFAERLGALLPLTPESERGGLVADALAAWRRADAASDPAPIDMLKS